MTEQIKPKAVLLDLDAIMNKKVAEVADLPDFVTPPSGLYALKVEDCKIEKFNVKENNKETGEKGSRIVVTYKIEEVVSIDTKSGDEFPPPVGSLFNIRFQGTEDGLEYFKKEVANILGSSDFGEATIGDLIDGIKNASFAARVTLQKSSGKDASGNTREYTNVRMRAAVPVPGATDE